MIGASDGVNAMTDTSNATTNTQNTQPQPAPSRFGLGQRRNQAFDDGKYRRAMGKTVSTAAAKRNSPFFSVYP